MRLPSWKSLAFFAVQLAIVAGLMWWIFRQPGFLEGFATAWQNVRLEWLAAGLLVAGASIAAHVWRWWLCLRLLGIPASWGSVGGVYLASSFIGTFIIGGIGGDAARILMMTRQFPGISSRLMVSVIADRLCGLISLIIPALIFTLPVQAELSQTPVGKTAVHFLWGYLVFATALFIFSFSSGSEKSRQRLPKWIPGRAWMLQISDAFEALRPDMRGLFAAIAASLLMLALHFATFWCVAKGCQANVSFSEMSAVMPVIEAATTVPATPSGLGIREEVFRDQLGSLCNVAAGTAVLISLGGFICGLVWNLCGGLAAAALLPRALSPTPHERIPDSDS